MRDIQHVVPRSLRLAFVAALACVPTIFATGGASQFDHLSKAERIDAIRHAQVWMPPPAPIASLDLRAGPPGKGAYAPFAAISCDFVDKTTGGWSAKFYCAVAPGDVVKVKYGEHNPEVYAEVATSRLLWALGFGTDRWYPVIATCHGCPPNPHHPEKTKTRRDVTEDIAALERKMPGKTMESTPDQGWAWKELDLVSEDNGADQIAQRDALKLLAVFLQHSDSKPIQQRLICLPDGETDEGCSKPFMYIHDTGLTFGRLSFLEFSSGANFGRWAAGSVWKDQGRCVGRLPGAITGTLTDPVIHEAGRKFLADLLVQLSDQQLRDMFEVARFDHRSSASIDAWIDLFKKKRDEIVQAHCPS
jgi:hypothetical protein